VVFFVVDVVSRSALDFYLLVCFDVRSLTRTFSPKFFEIRVLWRSLLHEYLIANIRIRCKRL
jgi:hypothetical protein